VEREGRERGYKFPEGIVYRKYLWKLQWIWNVRVSD